MYNTYMYIHHVFIILHVSSVENLHVNLKFHSCTCTSVISVAALIFTTRPQNVVTTPIFGHEMVFFSGYLVITSLSIDVKIRQNQVNDEHPYMDVYYTYMFMYIFQW